MKIFRFCITLLLVSGYASAQNKATLDSLQKVLKTNISDKQKVDVYNLLAKEYRKSKMKQAVNYALQAAAVAERVNYLMGIAEAWSNLGWINSRKGNYQEAMIFFRRMLQKAQEANYKKGIAKAYNGIGATYWHQGHYDRAIKTYQKGLDIRQKLGDKRGIAANYNNIGVVYKKQGKYAIAQEFYQKASKINAQIGNQKALANNHNNIGNILHKEGNYLKALEVHHKALDIRKQIQDKKGIATSFYNIGFIHQVMGNDSEALEAYQKSLKIKKQIGDRKGIANSYRSIGNIYLGQGNYTKASGFMNKGLRIQQQIGNKSGIAESYLELGKLALVQKKDKVAKKCFRKALQLRKTMGEKALSAEVNVNLGIAWYIQRNHAKAQAYLEKGVQTALKLSNPVIVRDGAEYLAKVYKAMGQPAQALENHMLFKQMADSLLNAQNIRQLAQIETEFVAQKREDSLQLMQHQKDSQYKTDIRQRKFTQSMTSLALGLSGALVLVLGLFYRSKQRSNLKLNQANENLESSNEEIKTVNNQLQELTEFKSRMTHMIIHDLKNPLASIMGIAASETEGRLDKTKISAIAQQMLHMTQDILDVQKTEEAELDLQLQKVEVHTISQQVIRQQQILASAKNINLHAPTLPNDSIQADPDILVRILSNLISNAIKFTPENGEIRLGSAYAENDTMLRLQVQDTGVGIPADQLDKVFDQFHSADKSQKGNFRSTGLGLTFCKLSVEKQGGNIGVESALGQGSTFWFTLPLTAKASPQHAPENTPVAAAESNPVLAEVARVKAQLQGKDLQLVKAIVAQIRKQGVNHTYPTRLARIFEMVKTKMKVSPAVEDWMQMLLKDAVNEAVFEALVDIEK